MAAITCSLNVVAKAAGVAAKPKLSVPKFGGSKQAAGRVVDVEDAVKKGLLVGCDPYPQGLDFFGFCNGLDTKTLKRYQEAELTHGRVSMLAALGFLVGEQVEGSSFLFDAQVTGPAINHFQQVPGLFWGLLGSFIFVTESLRVQKGWQDPFVADKLFLLNDDHVAGEYDFDPLGLSNGKDAEWLKDMKLKEVNNGRVAMIAISGMVAQELVNGLNIIPADEVLEMGKEGALKAMEAQCAGGLDEAACAKAFEASERAILFFGDYFN